eukprot:TRINITY_DN2563_c0_g2_i1.p1 TRINITY_DN2563_c0_g2~~TRINITY_DN2563_c0_g2_i1.p1  ORF type:complete len:296 (-),score=3.09 TRINITY_DN2563_c0_g2_i1:48-935(-)
MKSGSTSTKGSSENQLFFLWFIPTNQLTSGSLWLDRERSHGCHKKVPVVGHTLNFQASCEMKDSVLLTTGMDAELSVRQCYNIFGSEISPGEFKYGTDGFGLHGFGVAIFDDGSYYEGGWEYGMRHGFGIQYSYDYDTTLLETYRGEWAEDLKHGKGVVTWRKECPTFYGVFLKERILGEFMGVFIWPQGDRMEGLFFCNGYPSGFGEHQNPQGGIYLGEYKGLFRHGRGKFIWPDGDQFNGTWKNGIRNGPGLLIRADGTVHYQKWNGEPMTFSLTPSKFPASNANNVNELSNI